MHAIVTELEKDGRVREITNFMIGDKHANQGGRIAKKIQERFDDSTLEYLGNSFKGGQPGHSAPPASAALKSPMPGFAHGHYAGSVGNNDDRVKLAIPNRLPA